MKLTVKRSGHVVVAETYIGPGCREHTRIQCLTCDTVDYVLQWEGSVLERVEEHLQSPSPSASFVSV